MSHRKKPFSGKKKKLQLQEKKVRKAKQGYWLDDPAPSDPPTVVTSLSSHFVPATTTTTDFGHDSQHAATKKLFSRFEKLSPDEIQRARLNSMKPLVRLSKPEGLEMGFSTEYLDFPKRPAWDYETSKEELEQQEEKAFEQWKQDIYQQTQGQELAWFEQNLQVWRQLWRVLEISNVVILVMDIRNPILHFPVPLYDYITRTLGRKMVGVFNKIDLVSDFTVFAWHQYFTHHYPKLHLADFSCFPRDSRLIDDTTPYALKQRVKRPRSRYYSAQGVQAVLRACERASGDTSQDWDGLIQRYAQEEGVEPEEETEEDDDDEDDTGSMDGLEDVLQETLGPHKDYLTIGLVGHPNVGKSSLVNSLMHRTVVSTSRTPGHTKHFQTIHLDPRIRLCDSPGLVFPALVPRSLQILSGMYPIAQVQEPYSVIQYLAERIPLEKILSLLPPTPDTTVWSAWMICEAYAEQRGYYTAKAARPDAYRAANALLRLATDGRILLSFKPPGFFETTTYEQLRVQAADQLSSSEVDDDTETEEDEEEEGGAVKTTQGQFAALALVDDE